MEDSGGRSNVGQGRLQRSLLRLGLDIVKHLGCIASNGAAAHIGVYRIVHRHVKRWEEAEDAVVTAVVPTAQDAVVDADAEEGEAKVSDVVDVADDHLLVPHFNGDGFFASNVNLAVVGERDILVVDAVVYDEGLVVRPKMVGGPTVQDSHLYGG